MQLFGISTLSVCKACDLSISDMINFLSEDRVHMKQGIFLDVQQSYILHSTISFDEASLLTLDQLHVLAWEINKRKSHMLCVNIETSQLRNSVYFVTPYISP